MLDQALMCLATTIYMESAHQPREAQIAVGYVLIEWINIRCSRCILSPTRSTK